ncbi:MAG: hypothetical protein Q9211_004581 [Gyalolechia sp. 1 TL-2023]
MASITAATALADTQTIQAANFNPKSNTNMAVYWGQGPSQQRLAHFCADSSIDIIPIGFLNIFPDQVNGGYPGTNFGNQCGGETYKNKDGSDSPLLAHCPSIGPDINTCQAMGKKILLSLGGAVPSNQSIKDDASAKSFATFLWKAFGPVDATYDGPRPFGDAVVDGFDFDIESEVSDNDVTTQYRGYGTMIDTLRTYFAADALKQYYIAGAPQCVIPDAHLAHPIENSWFDFLFIQFYNTPQCSARAYFDTNYGRQGDQPSMISFDAWVGFIRTSAMNKDVKLYIGLPAAPLPQVVYDTNMYIAPDDVVNLIDDYQCKYPQEFGGIMVWEATYSEQNLIDGKPFVDVIKGQLRDGECAQKPETSSSSVSTSTMSSSSAIGEATLSTTSSSSEIASASASLPSYASSTGAWNTTHTPGPTASVGTGSIHPSSTGIWNSSATVPAGAGSSSIILHPTSADIWNSSSTFPVGTGSSFIHPYPTETGVWNSTYVPGPTSPETSGTGYQSSSVPVNTSTSPSSYISTSSSDISTFSPHSTGASSGFSNSVPVTSVPYPVTIGTTSPTTIASGGIIYTTKTITITDCPPQVTSCPVHTTVITYSVTTSSSISVTESSSVPVTTSSSIHETASSGILVTSVPTHSPETTISGSISLTASHTPVSTMAAAPGVTTTKIGTPPAEHGQGSQTGPAPGHGGSSSSASPPSGSGNSPVGFGSHPAPQPEQPAHGSSASGENSSAPQPELPAHGGSPAGESPSSSGSDNSPVGSDSGSGSHPGPEPEQSAYEGSPSLPYGGSSPSSGNGNSPIGAGDSPSSSSGSSSSLPSYGSSSGSNHLPAQPQNSAASAIGAGDSEAPYSVGANGPDQPSSNTPSQAQGPAAPGLSTTLGTLTRQNTATVQNINAAASPSPIVPGSSSPESASISSLPAVVTQTIVPIPLHPSQTAQSIPAGEASSTGGLSPVQASPAPIAPFPAGNGTVAVGPSGTLSPSASISGSIGGSPTVVPFTGAAAGRVGAGAFASMMGILAAVMVV